VSPLPPTDPGHLGSHSWLPSPPPQLTGKKRWPAYPESQRLYRADAISFTVRGGRYFIYCPPRIRESPSILTQRWRFITRYPRAVVARLSDRAAVIQVGGCSRLGSGWPSCAAKSRPCSTICRREAMLESLECS
jgi:hypothetical protein